MTTESSLPMSPFSQLREYTLIHQSESHSLFEVLATIYYDAEKASTTLQVKNVQFCLFYYTNLQHSHCGNNITLHGSRCNLLTITFPVHQLVILQSKPTSVPSFEGI
jgi:hypothetical protein